MKRIGCGIDWERWLGPGGRTTAGWGIKCSGWIWVELFLGTLNLPKRQLIEDNVDLFG